MRSHPQTGGALLLLVLHAVFIFGMAGMRGDLGGIKGEAAPLIIGVMQLYYVIPAVLLALKMHHPAVAKGVLKAAVATFALNLAGCAYMAVQLGRIT